MNIAAQRRSAALKGARLQLDIFKPEHITHRYLTWLSDDQVNEFSRRLGKPRMSAQDAHAWLQSLGEDEVVYAIQAPRFGHIGNVKYGPINWSNLAVDISILIGEKESWGHGFGAEAVYLVSKHLFEDRQVNRLAAASVNPAFIRMVQKLGWQQEGVQREESRVGGKFYDSVLLSLLKRDFKILEQYEPAAS